MSADNQPDVTMNEEGEENEQNEAEAIKIRTEYRNIRERMNVNRMDYVDPNSNAIEDTFEQVQNVFRGVKKPREAVSDSHALLELALLGKERIRNVKCEFKSFNPVQFMDKLKIFMAKMDPKQTRPQSDEENEEEDEEGTNRDQQLSNRDKKLARSYVLKKEIIRSFGQHAMNYFLVQPRPTFLLGSLEKEIIVTHKKVRQKKVVEKPNEETRTKIKELDANSKENETSVTLSETERIYKILSKLFKKSGNVGICFYEFTINPFSFSRTIENIFYVSFLVKDGHVRICLDEDKLPIIEPIINKDQASADNQEAARASNANIQSMISLTKLEWKEIIEVFQINNAVIPNPPNSSRS